ncbi:MAG: hypothetical protein QOD86_2760 [Miltoncostaeaceae bacterium]|jgi:signal transduction histidine kinase|nr:hypothetical protein [Miltoncostaeaceae bacterium]
MAIGLGWLQLGALLLVLTATVVGAALVFRGEAHAVDDSNHGWAARAADELHEHVGQAAAILGGIQGLYLASDGVMTPTAFERFAAIPLRDSSLLGISWVPRVAAADRVDFERTTGVRIAGFGPAGPRAATPRAEYFPLLYIAPRTPDTVAVTGLDISTDPAARAPLEAARDTDRPAMGPPSVIGGDQAAAGVVLLRAVYAPGAPTRTVAQRRAALRGYATGVYLNARLGAVIAETIPAGARAQVIDDGEVLSGPSGRIGGAAESTTVAGRRWTVRVDTGARPALTPSLLVLLAGLTFGGLLGLVLAQANRRERLSRLAQAAGLRRESEQSALRRVATAVAANADPEEFFRIVAHEAAGLLGAEYGAVIRFQGDEGVVASFGGPNAVPNGHRILLTDGAGVLAQVARSGAPARVQSYATLLEDPAYAPIRSFGWRGSVAAPVRLAGELWGAVAVATAATTPFADDAEARLAEFAALVGMGIADAEARAGLRASQEELRRQVSIVRAVLDTAPEAIRMVDPAGRTVVANAAADRLIAEIGAGRTYASAHEWFEVLADKTVDPEGSRAFALALAEDLEGTVAEEYELSGSGRIFRCYSAPVRVGADSGSILGRVFITAEVTDERRHERAKDEFTQLASHELRTPLTSILGYLEVLLDGDAGELAPEQRRFLDVIDRNAQRLLRLVGDLLVVARADGGRLSVELDPIDLGAIAAGCAENADPVAQERHIALEVEVEPLVLRGDGSRLAGVVDNLLSNALKFTPPSGRILVRARAEGGRAILEVADTGVGIPAAEQGFLFERFYRTEAARRAAVPGTGLGLAISRMIVEAHGGTIGVESEEGRGTTFRVELPLAGAGRDASGASLDESAGTPR